MVALGSYRYDFRGMWHAKEYISCGHTTDFYLGKSNLPRVNSSKISRGKFISGFVLPR